ncbi:MAG TPA: alpha/beta hydrolase [Chloroflexota bacterium]
MIACARVEELSIPRTARFLALFGGIVLFLWAALPVARAGALVITNPFHRAASRPAGLPAQQAQFHASDGVSLHGWLARRSAAAPTVILVPGFKAGALSMVPYARLLLAGGFNALLYDSRGIGGSGGRFTLGVREVDDVRGAVSYLNGRHDLAEHRYGLLGVSLGAGVAIVAAAHLREIAATVADSAYTDQRRTVERLDSLRFGPVLVPLAPIAPWTVDRLIGVSLGSFSPLRAVRRIAPRPLLLIHSRHDTNPTTPLSGALELERAAGPHASLWIAPRGGHAGALAAQLAEYRRRVLAFFRRYLP